MESSFGVGFINKQAYEMNREVKKKKKKQKRRRQQEQMRMMGEREMKSKGLPVQSQRKEQVG